MDLEPLLSQPVMDPHPKPDRPVDLIARIARDV